MEIKIGDIIKNRYIIKTIMLDPKKQLKEPVFIVLDKKKNEYIELDKKQMLKILNIKEVKNDYKLSKKMESRNRNLLHSNN